MGAPYALVACFLVASLYFMYRFFSKGISSQHIVKGGLNVLFSGLFAALALAMNTLAIFPAAGIDVYKRQVSAQDCLKKEKEKCSICRK